jgi:uncharacterized repeat protein (TIGR01451 family)
MIMIRSVWLVGVLLAGASLASANNVELRVLQGEFQSAQDRQALVKAIGSETRLGNPNAGTGDGAADDQFGYAVALSGDTALIGARSKDIGVNGAQGAAYVFVRSGTTWSRQALLIAADGAAGDQFGRAVAVAGDVIAIGAPADDNASIADQGSVYLYARSAGAWNLVSKFTASDGEAGDEFGASLALGSTHLIVGTPLDDNAANTNQGSAHVFALNAGSWSFQTKLTASDGGWGDQFGGAVALSGNTVLIGAVADDVAAGDQGSAYVFVRSGSVWTQQVRLSAADGAGGDAFGSSVALSGSTALIGVPNDDIGSDVNCGSAYVFTANAGVWTERLRLSAGDGASGDLFGAAVALDGTRAVIGARGDDHGANADQGAVYWFNGSGASWTELQKLVVAGGAAGDGFGAALTMEGDTLVTGIAFDDIDTRVDEGSAPVYFNNGAAWNVQATLIAGVGSAGDRFGAAVALSGDSALIGMPGDDIGANADQGAAYVFVRNGGVWAMQARLTANDGAAGDVFGEAVAIDGDTAVVGAWRDDNGANVDEGSGYVFVRSGTSWTQQVKLLAFQGAAEDFLGRSVAISGNTVLLGAHFDNVGANPDQGSAVVFTRSGSAWSQQARLIASDGQSTHYLGYSVALSGDTALLGAIGDDQTAINSGAAYVFVRSGASWSQSAKLKAGDAAANDGFGIAVAVSGDNALVGAPQDDVDGANNQGSAYFFTRSGSSWTQQLRASHSDAPNDLFGDTFGAAVALDGNAALISAPRAVVGANGRQGAAWTYSRVDGVWQRQSKIIASDGVADDTLGGAVALSGARLVVGAVGDDGAISAANPDEGAAYVFSIEHTVTANAGANGSISPAGAVTVAANQAATFTLTPATNYGVSSVTGCGGTWSGGNQYTTLPVVADCTVNAIFANTPPTMAALNDVSVLEDSPITSIVIDISDMETAAANISVSAGSNNTALIPTPAIIAGANVNQRLLNLQPATNANGGPVTITVTASDPLGASAQRTFQVSVTAVNDAPAMSTINLSTYAAASSGARTVPGFASMTAGPADEVATQTVAGFIIDSIADADAVLVPGSLSLSNAGTLNFTLTGVGGIATVNARVRDSGGSANGGVDTSLTHTFAIAVAPGADLQIAKSNARSMLVDGDTTVYAIVVANAGPNAVSGARVRDLLPATLINASWMCVPSASTAPCPNPATGIGSIDVNVNLGVAQFLRFDLMAEVDGSVGSFVTNTARIDVPAGVAGLDAGNDSATDQDSIVPDGVFADGFENAASALTVPGAAAALLVGD